MIVKNRNTLHDHIRNEQIHRIGNIQYFGNKQMVINLKDLTLKNYSYIIFHIKCQNIILKEDNNRNNKEEIERTVRNVWKMECIKQVQITFCILMIVVVMKEQYKHKQNMYKIAVSLQKTKQDKTQPMNKYDLIQAARE